MQTFISQRLIPRNLQTPMYETILLSLRSKLDPDSRVIILHSSEDQGLHDYFEEVHLYGSTDMDPEDGKIYVKLHDKHRVDKLTWLEEFTHALQFLRYGNISLSCDDADRKAREVEAASCILENAKKLRLTAVERAECLEWRQYYESR